MKKSQLKNFIKEIILDEAGLYTLKNPGDSTKGLATTLDPDDATEKSPAFQSKYKKISENIDYLNEAAKMLSKIQKRLDEMLAEYKSGKLSKEKYINERKKLQKYRDTLNTEIMGFNEYED